MSKVFSLWRNEMARICKRTFVIVLLIIMVVLCFAVSGFMKFAERMSSSDNNHYLYSDTDYVDEQIAFYEKEIPVLEKEAKLLDEKDAAYESKYADLTASRSEYEYYLILQKYEISYYTSYGYLDRTAYQLADYRTQEAYPDYYNLSDAENQTLRENIADCEAILKEKNYKKYIEHGKKVLESTSGKTLSADELEIQKKALDYQYLCDPQGENSYYYQEIENWKEAKLNLLYERYTDDNGNYLPLTDALRAKLKDNIAVYEYKLENGLSGDVLDGNIPSLAMTLSVGLCSSFLLFVLLILAGSSISSDIQTGAIKGLIIAPVRRSKIFTAKVLALLTVGVVGTLVCALVSLASQCVWFGFSTVPSYVYAVNGVARELPAIVYLVAQLFVSLIPILLIVSFAMMMSAITRNTAVSVGVSIAVYYICSGAASIFSSGLLRGEWTKFLPFQHMDLTAAFFPYSITSSLMDELGISASPSLSFSLCYLAILILCLGYTAFDSFTRRDI